jgi:hypothetical protein
LFRPSPTTRLRFASHEEIEGLVQHIKHEAR